MPPKRKATSDRYDRHAEEPKIKVELNDPAGELDDPRRKTSMETVARRHGAQVIRRRKREK